MGDLTKEMNLGKRVLGLVEHKGLKGTFGFNNVIGLVLAY
jgi:hypothetical protein